MKNIYIFILLIFLSCKKDRLKDLNSDRRIYILDSVTQEGIADAEVELYKDIDSAGVVVRCILVGQGKSDANGIFMIPDSLNLITSRFRVYAKKDQYAEMDFAERISSKYASQKCSVFLTPYGYLKVHVKKITPPEWQRSLRFYNVSPYSGRKFFIEDSVDENIIFRCSGGGSFSIYYYVLDSLNQESKYVKLDIKRFDTTYYSVTY